MQQKHNYQIGEIVKMKKPHPCGGEQWEITRTGIDFGLKCLQCGRQVMIPRPKFEKGVKAIIAAKQKVDLS